jgi:tetratricopeptide (TPR) repeat protein
LHEGEPGYLDEAERYARVLIAAEGSSELPDGLRILGEIMAARGDLAAAASLFDEALQELLAHSNRYLKAYTRRSRGLVRLRRGMPEEARADLLAALHLSGSSACRWRQSAPHCTSTDTSPDRAAACRAGSRKPPGPALRPHELHPLAGAARYSLLLRVGAAGADQQSELTRVDHPGHPGVFEAGQGTHVKGQGHVLHLAGPQFTLTKALSSF